jgi:hypothetical protein
MTAKLLILLSSAALLVGVTLVLLMLNYVGGYVFDYIMGTNLLPVFFMGALVGIGVSLRKPDKNVTIGQQLRHSANWVAVYPFAALFGASVANWFFPETTKDFIRLAGYEGSIYSLVFWGAIIGGIMIFVKNIFLSALPETFKS